MSPNPIRRRLVLAFVLGFLATPFVCVSARAADITVFAAASLKNALDDAVQKYEAKTGDKVVVSYAASSALAKQIEQAAPADIFFSADLDWMDYLEQRKLIDPASRHTLLGNTLVLVAPKDSTVSLVIEKNFPLLQALGPDGKLAMASVVRIDIGNGVVITSSITNEAVDDLGLAMGDDVVAVIKASDVMVGKRTELCPDRRLLGGHGPQPYLERVTSACRAPGNRQTAARARRPSFEIASRRHYRCDLRDWTGKEIGPLHGGALVDLARKSRDHR